jgi:hypothetical protein
MPKPVRYGELHVVINNYTGVEGVRLLSTSSKNENVPIQLYAQLFPLIKKFQEEVAEKLKVTKNQKPATDDTERVGK